MNMITKENFADLLGTFIEESKISIKRIAKAIGCSEMTLTRLVTKKTLPTDETMKQIGAMIEIGFLRYKKLTAAEKEKISSAVGTVAGGAVGFSAIAGAISVLGTAGLSASGISTGLVVIGGIVGGGMVAGITLAATIPIALGAAGYGFVKLIKSGATELKVNMKDIDKKWEMEVC